MLYCSYLKLLLSIAFFSVFVGIESFAQFTAPSPAEMQEYLRLPGSSAEELQALTSLHIPSGSVFSSIFEIISFKTNDMRRPPIRKIREITEFLNQALPQIPLSGRELVTYIQYGGTLSELQSFFTERDNKRKALIESLVSTVDGESLLADYRILHANHDFVRAVLALQPNSNPVAYFELKEFFHVLQSVQRMNTNYYRRNFHLPDVSQYPHFLSLRDNTNKNIFTSIGSLYSLSRLGFDRNLNFEAGRANSRSALMLFASNDHAGALGSLSVQNLIRTVSGQYSVHGRIISNEQNVCEAIRQHPGAKLLFLSGHGDAHTLSLNAGDPADSPVPSEDEPYVIDTRDEDLAHCFDSLAPDATIVFLSCSTGAAVEAGRQNLASFIHRISGRKVIAPKEDTYGFDFHVDSLVPFAFSFIDAQSHQDYTLRLPAQPQ